MTDQEADSWFEKHAGYEEMTLGALTVYLLARKGEVSDESVSFVIAQGQPRPPALEVKRFLARWFVSAYED